MFNISSLLAKHPDDVYEVAYRNMKTVLKQQLNEKFTQTSINAPVHFILKIKHSYKELNNQKRPLFLLGNWKGPFKNWALKIISKEKDCLVGKCYFGGLTEDKKKLIKISFIKGKGIRNEHYISKAFRAILPTNQFQIKTIQNQVAPNNTSKRVQDGPIDKLRTLTNKIIELKNRLHNIIDKSMPMYLDTASKLCAVLDKWLSTYQLLPKEAQNKRKDRALKFNLLLKKLKREIA
jgi:RimJ/RimL family protein N-acetyltransferase